MSQGSVFKSAKIGCGGDDMLDSQALQENCQDVRSIKIYFSNS